MLALELKKFNDKDPKIENFVLDVAHWYYGLQDKKDKKNIYSEKNREIVELLNTAFRLLLNQKIGAEHPYGWLGVFDADELNEFINEVISAYRSVAFQETKNFDKAWNELEAIIHEWYESALAITNPELEAAFTQIKQS